MKKKKKDKKENIYEMDTKMWQTRRKKEKEVMVTIKGKRNKQIRFEHWKDDRKYIKIWFQKKRLVTIKQIVMKI